VLVWALVAAAAVVLLVRRPAPDLERRQRGRAPLQAIPGVHGRTGGVAAALVAAAAFWLARSRQTLLGDADPILMSLPAGAPVHPREPLAVWLQQSWYDLLHPFVRPHVASDRAAAFTIVGLESVVLGFCFVLVAFALARELSMRNPERRAASPLIAALLLTQGYMVLFFGYVENYAIHALFIAMYLTAALREIRGRGSFILTASVFVITLGMHLATLALLPSLGLLAIRALRDRARRREVSLGLAIAIALLLALDGFLRGAGDGRTLWQAMAAITETARGDRGAGGGVAYLVSARHLVDFVNAQYLLGPFGAFLFLGMLGLALTRREDRKVWREPSGGFLLLAAAFPLLGSFLMSEPLLGYGRDWDLFASAGVTYTAAASFLILQERREFSSRVLAFCVVVSALHLAPWVAMNASEERSLERFKTLPLGFGRTGVTVGRVYLDRGDYAGAEHWLRVAIEEHPANAFAHSYLGMVFDATGRSDLAARAHERAVALRPDKAEFHTLFVRSLVATGRFEPAIAEFEWLLERAPGDLTLLDGLATTYDELNRPGEAAATRERLLAALSERCRNDASDTACLDQGVVLMKLGRPDEAIDVYRRVLARDPRSEAALFNLGLVLTNLNRIEEARAVLHELVRVYPRHGQAEWIQKALGEARRP
jgi:tetratricopeptide (TPR) repeat protein